MCAGIASFSQEKAKVIEPLNEKSTLQSGKDFLANNSKRKEVVSLESGLQYEILVQGSGPKPGPTARFMAISSKLPAVSRAMTTM